MSRLLYNRRQIDSCWKTQLSLAQVQAHATSHVLGEPSSAREPVIPAVPTDQPGMCRHPFACQTNKAQHSSPSPDTAIHPQPPQIVSEPGWPLSGSMLDPRPIAENLQRHFPGLPKTIGDVSISYSQPRVFAQLVDVQCLFAASVLWMRLVAAPAREHVLVFWRGFFVGFRGLVPVYPFSGGFVSLGLEEVDGLVLLLGLCYAPFGHCWRSFWSGLYAAFYTGVMRQAVARLCHVFPIIIQCSLGRSEYELRFLMVGRSEIRCQSLLYSYLRHQ